MKLSNSFQVYTEWDSKTFNLYTMAKTRQCGVTFTVHVWKKTL